MPTVPKEYAEICECHTLISQPTYTDTDRGRQYFPAEYGCAEGGPCQGGATNEWRPQCSRCPQYGPLEKQDLRYGLAEFKALIGMECPHCIYENRPSRLLLYPEKAHLACSNSECDGNWYCAQDFLDEYQSIFITTARESSVLRHQLTLQRIHSDHQQAELRRLWNKLRGLRTT